MSSRKNERKIIWKIKGMHCTSCVELVRQELSSLPEVKDISVSLSDNQAVLFLENGTGEPSIDEAGKRLSSFGFSIESAAGSSKSNGTGSINSWLKSFTAAAAVFFVFKMLERSGIISFPGTGGGLAGPAGPLLALIMGLAASVSSCLAVVGSVVISFSMLYQPDNKKSFTAALVPNMIFQAGRIGGFAVLGGMLGMIGGTLSVTGPMLGMIEIVVVILLLGAAASILGAGHLLEKTGLRMPSSISRLIGRLKTSRNPAAPLLLGALTFFLPCGFTQSMQAAALGSGSFFSGALIMLAFSLGTYPVLLAAGLTAGWSRGRSAIVVQRAAGMLIAAFAVSTLFNAIPLFSYSGNLFGDNSAGGQASASSVSRPAVNPGYSESDNIQNIEMRVTFRGFEPAVLEVKKGIPVNWTIWGDQVTGCTNAIIIPSLKAKFSVYPGENKISFTPLEAGIINYSCWMGMVRGSIRVVD